MKSVGREEEEKKKKKETIDRRASQSIGRSWKRKVTECDREWYEVNDLFAFLRSFTEALAEPLLRASAASHHIQHERVASTGPLVIALGVAYVPETEREKRTSLKSVLRPGETISGIVKIYLWIVGKELMINDG